MLNFLQSVLGATIEFTFKKESQKFTSTLANRGRLILVENTSVPVSPSNSTLTIQ